MNRGFKSDEEISNYLFKDESLFYDPFLINGMQVATETIKKAISCNDKIAVYGDYDVDGITSTAVFVKYLRALGIDVVWHLPTREGEGYGLNNDAITDIVNDNVNLMITVDCGISGVDEVAFAKQSGLTVVVTDHHSPDAVLPNADAIVNLI